MRNILFIIAISIFINAGIVCADETIITRNTDIYTLLFQGKKVTDENAKDLLMKLEKDPHDLESRYILIGYYLHKKYSSDAARNKFNEHILWLIDNHPEAPPVSFPFLTKPHGLQVLFRYEDWKFFHEAETHWLNNVKNHPNDAIIHGNAAKFFEYSDKTRAINLLKTAKKIDPDNPRWPRSLADYYEHEIQDEWTVSNKHYAEKALAEFEYILQILDGEQDRFETLWEAAKIAYTANDLDKAKSYADEVLILAPKYKEKSRWDYAAAVFYGNITLGKIAFRKKDIEQAKSHLIEAGKINESFYITIPGPDMSLAKWLLEKGEKETVLQFLDQCNRFWTHNNGQVDDWINKINNGITPDFKIAHPVFNQ